MSNSVLILGAGPSGMMAAHAVAQLGLDPVIVDKDPDRQRRNSGIYYLHSSCELAISSAVLQQRVLGGSNLADAELAAAYGQKVYGTSDVSSSSILDARYQSQVTIYNAAEALDHLWQMYGHRVIKSTVDGFEQVESMSQLYSKVISTIPASVLFPHIQYAYDEAYVHASTAPVEDCFVYYNVGKVVPWYRCSAVFGLFTAEYTARERVGDYDWKRVVKVKGKSAPLPYYDWLICTGRYGAWDKGFLTDLVFTDVLGSVSKRGWAAPRRK